MEQQPPQQSQPLDSFGINYGPLELLLSYKGIFDGHKYAALLIPAGVIAGVVLIFFLTYVGILLIALSLGYAAKLQNERNAALWRKFASVNKWNVHPAALAESYVPPTLGGIGHSRKLSEVIEGAYSNNNFRIFTYQYTVGSGKNSHTYTYTILQIVLPKPLPSFIVDSLRVAGAKNIPNGYQKVSLEGNFDKTFQLYIPAGASADVLSVVSPDVMQTLITSNTMQDIESAAGSVWFIQTGDTRGQKVLPKLFAAVDQLTNEFNHRIKTYKITNAQAHVAAIPYAGGATHGNQALAFEEIKRSPVAKIFIVIFLTVFISIFGFIILMFIMTTSSIR